MEKNMKKYLSFMLGVAFVLGIIFSIPATAQVYSEFEPPVNIQKGSYTDLVNDVYLPHISFTRVSSTIIDTINGYVQIPIGFDFEFNGNTFSHLWVCVNGFVTFNNPLSLSQELPEGLFTFDEARYQNNVIAPYWGNHCYRATSRISYKTSNNVLTVQWQNLNVNDPTNPTRVASFQVKLYKSADTTSRQGNIEFCYSSVGMNVGVGAAVGIKGSSFHDFLNALLYYNPSQAAISEQKTLNYPPTGATDSVFLFKPVIRYRDTTKWGDGDVDMSKNFRHSGMPQNRYVTINDAYLILNAIATRTPLDSVRGRQAFHGDVNHNGRYYYDLTLAGAKVNIPWRDEYYDQNINVPPYVNVPSKTNIFFQVSEFDGAMILHYLSARLPKLPWLIDTIVQYGKIVPQELLANNINIGEIVKVNDNTYRFPVLLNGYFNGSVASKIEFNGKILNVESNTSDDKFLFDYSNDLFVFAGAGEFEQSIPLVYVTVAISDDEMNLNNVTFNDNLVANQNYKLPVENSIVGSDLLLQNTPNPFTSNTNITLNIAQEGNYTLTVYDLSGNRLNVLANEYLTAGQYSYQFDGTDSYGNQLSNGMYIYKLTGNNTSVSMKMLLNR